MCTFSTRCLNVGLLTLSTLFLGCSSRSPEVQRPRDTTGVVHISLLGAETFPEGIASHERTGELFVGSIGERGIQVIRDGRASWFKQPGTDGLLNVIGLAVDSSRNRLWACSTEFADPSITPSLKVFDTTSGQLLATLELPTDGSPHFLNDVDLDDAGNAYATDSLTPTIWRADAKLTRVSALVTSPAFTIDPQGFNLNGVVVTPDQRFLLVSAPSAHEDRNGHLFRVALADAQVAEVDLSPAYLGADGLVALDQHRMLSSGGPPGLHRLDFDADFLHAHVTPLVAPSAALELPTTSALSGSHVWVVNSQLDHYVKAVFGDRGPPKTPFEVIGIPLEAL